MQSEGGKTKGGRPALTEPSASAARFQRSESWWPGSADVYSRYLRLPVARPSRPRTVTPASGSAAPSAASRSSFPPPSRATMTEATTSSAQPKGGRRGPPRSPPSRRTRTRTSTSPSRRAGARGRAQASCKEEGGWLDLQDEDLRGEALPQEQRLGQESSEDDGQDETADGTTRVKPRKKKQKKRSRLGDAGDENGRRTGRRGWRQNLYWLLLLALIPLCLHLGARRPSLEGAAGGESRGTGDQPRRPGGPGPFGAGLSAFAGDAAPRS